MSLSKIRQSFPLSSNKKALLANATSLYFIRGVNMLFPLILIPLIISRLSLAAYGAYSIVVSVLSILILIMDFGFTYTATRDVAKMKHDQKALSEYFSCVVLIQGLVFVVALVILVALSFHPRFYPYQKLLLLCSVTLAGNLLNPAWLYQGMENAYVNAVINIIFRLSTIFILYFCLRQETGLYFLFLIYSLGFLGWGITGFVVAIKKYSLRLVKVSKAKLAAVFEATLSVFIANLVSSFYLAGIPMILNFVDQPLPSIASYSVAERIIRGICTIVSPLSIAFIPYFVSKSAEREDILITKYLNIGLRISIPFLVLSLILLFGLQYIVRLIVAFRPGLEFDIQTLNNIRVQSLIVFFSVLNNIIGISTFISLGYRAEFRNIMLAVFFLAGISFFFVLRSGTGYVGSIVAVLAEFVLTVLLIVYLKLKQSRLRAALT